VSQLNEVEIARILNEFLALEGDARTAAIEQFLFVHSANGLSGLQWQAMVQLFTHPEHLTHQQVVDIFGNIAEFTGLNPEALMSAHATLQQLSLQVNAQFMGQIEPYLWDGSGNRADLEAALRRAQLLTFMEALGPGAVNSAHFHNLGTFNTDEYLLHGNSGLFGLITPNQYHASRFYHLSNGGEFTGVSWANALESTATQNVDWANLMLGAAGFIPVVGGFIGGASFAGDALNALGQPAGNAQGLSNAERAALMIAAARMGGGGAGIQTPNGGFGVVGATVNTQQAMINFGGLQTQRGTYQLSQAEAVVALVNENHPNRSAVYNYINRQDNRQDGNSRRSEFERNLQITYDNMDGNSGNSIFDLPLPDLADFLSSTQGN